MTITQVPGAPGRGPAGVPLAGASDPLELLGLLQDYVARTAPLLPEAEPTLRERTYERLALNDEVEIWLIHWPTGRGLELHDHGGSTGALWVVRGNLDEHAVGSDGRVARRRIAAGSGAAFGATYVHDVVNHGTGPATSVHAYSPPMTSMTFYRQEGAHLAVARSEQRTDPSWAP
jgi:hypothetical protein